MSSSSGTRASRASIAAGTSSAAAVPDDARDCDRRGPTPSQGRARRTGAALVDVRMAAQGSSRASVSASGAEREARRRAGGAHAAARQLVGERPQQDSVSGGGHETRMATCRMSLVSVTRLQRHAARMGCSRGTALRPTLSAAGARPATGTATPPSGGAGQLRRVRRRRARTERPSASRCAATRSAGGVALHVALAARARHAAGARLHHRRHRGRRRARRAPRGRSPPRRRARTDRFEQFIERWRTQPLFADDPPEVAELAREDQRRNRPHALATALRGIGTGEMTPLSGAVGRPDGCRRRVVGTSATRSSAPSASAWPR